MTDRLGVLGINSDVAVGTYTSYTVSPSQAAKVRVQFRGVAGSASTLSVKINGCDIFDTAALTVGNISYSSSQIIHASSAASGIDGSTDAKTVAPFNREYMLSEGDTVTYTIGTAAFTAMNFQTIGVALDVG